MNEQQLRQHAQCSLCRNKIGASGGLPLFWTVVVQRHGINMQAVHRHDSFAAMMGSNMLARVMGDVGEVTEPMMEPVELTVCEGCAMSPEGASVFYAALNK